MVLEILIWCLVVFGICVFIQAILAGAVSESFAMFLSTIFSYTLYLSGVFAVVAFVFYLLQEVSL